MSRPFEIRIDARGWAQADDRPSWRPSDRGKTRLGLPWTPAEDRTLLQRVATARSFGWDDPTILAAAHAHGRSSCAVATRVSALRAGIRLAMAASQAAKETQA